jgi:hypothetical protein
VARFLSPEWLAQLEAAAAGARLRDTADGLDLTVRQVVRGGPGGDLAYTVHLSADGVTVTPGGEGGDLEVAQDYATAAAISQGRLTPAAAFAAGRIKLGGRLDLLVGHASLLAGLGDLFSSVRASTEY